MYADLEAVAKAGGFRAIKKQQSGLVNYSVSNIDSMTNKSYELFRARNQLLYLKQYMSYQSLCVQRKCYYAG